MRWNREYTRGISTPQHGDCALVNAAEKESALLRITEAHRKDTKTICYFFYRKCIPLEKGGAAKPPTTTTAKIITRLVHNSKQFGAENSEVVTTPFVNKLDTNGHGVWDESSYV